MRIHVSKDGKRFGPFTADEIKAHLSAGHFSESDHAMPEGGSEWQGILEILGGSDDASPPFSEDDDIDYEKLKQWEEQFEDFEDDEEQKRADASVQTSPVSNPQSSPPVQAPAPSVQPPVPVESPPQPADVDTLRHQTVPEPSTVETPPPETASSTSEPPLPQPASEDNDTDKEPPPPRRKRRKRAEPEDEEYDDAPRSRNRRSSWGGGSRKISGMNRGQTVIVVKGGGIGAKIFTSLIVMLVVSLIIGVIGFGAFFAAPNTVGPLLKKIGIPVEIPAAAKERSSSVVPLSDETQVANFSGLGLTEDEVQQLRSIAVEFFKTDGGEALRCVASVEPDLTVNDEDLLALESIAVKLVWLDCSKGNLTDAALSRISNLPNIRRLYLEDNKGITSRGVSDLAGLGKLQCLNLVGTSLDDAVIEILTGMSGLREVYLWRSGVSVDAVQRLRTARPDMLVQSG